MAQKASTPAKKGGAVKPGTQRVSRGDSVTCEVCGFSVVVDEVGDVAVSEETTLFCCGKPMKARKSPQKAKAAKPAKEIKTLSGWPTTPVAGSSTMVPDPKEDVEQQ